MQKPPFIGNSVADFKLHKARRATGLLDVNGNPIMVAAGTEVRKPSESKVIKCGDYMMPWPAEHMQPDGFLLRDRESALLWTFLKAAHLVIKEIPDQVSYEGDADCTVQFTHMIDSLCTCYGVQRADVFTPERWRRAKAQALSLNRDIDPRVSAFIDSGGQLYNTYDRGDEGERS